MPDRDPAPTPGWRERAEALVDLLDGYTAPDDALYAVYTGTGISLAADLRAALAAALAPLLGTPEPSDG